MSGEAPAASEQQPDKPSAEDVASFKAGFDLINHPPETQSPQGTEDQPEPASKEQQPAPEPTPAPTPAPSPEPKTVSISESDWNDVRSKAAAFDEHTRQISTLSGNLGGLKQQVEKLQRSGVTKITADKLVKTAADFPELAAAIAEDLSSILSAPAGTTLEPEEVERRARELLSAEVTPQVNALERKLLKVAHPDWVDVLRSDEFRAYQQTLPPAENAKLMESMDGEYVADHISAFKKRKAETARPPAAPAPQATPQPTAAPRKNARQERLEAAAPVKGQGAGAETPDPVDDFNAGWKLKGAA